MKTVRRTRGVKMTDQLIRSMRASILACILTALLVLALALMLRWDVFSENALQALIIVIKALSASFAGFMHRDYSIRRIWLLAGLSGVLYMALSLIVFSLLSGEFAVRWSHVSDILMGFACAACTCLLRGMLIRSGESKR